MKRNTYIAIVTFTLVFSSCKKEETVTKGKIKMAEWLIGNWENKTDQGTLSENWEKTNDSVFHGQSYFIKKKDTLHSELVELSQKGEELIYSPVVKGQNNDLPVAFKLTSATANQLVFENLAHDFPQRISYKRITADSLLAEISGKQQGNPTSESYPMKRKNKI